MNLENTLDILTDMSKKQRSTVLKWNAKQEETHVHLMFEKQRNHYFKISNKKEEKTILYQAALYLAAEELYHTLRSLNTKNRTRSLDDIKNITKVQAKQFRKRTRKAEKTEKLFDLKTKIQYLKVEENFSYREISEFLEAIHNFTVSGNWIRIKLFTKEK